MTTNPSYCLNRRRWLQISSLGWFELAAATQSRIRANEQSTARPPSNVKSCILVFHYGGPSQFETYDPKPNAPADIRGEYRQIATRVPGIQIGEYLPQVAQCMDRLALVRSMHHPMRNHNSAAAEVLTGRTPAGGDQELLADELRSYPTLGSSVGFGLGPRANLLPYVALPYTIYNVVQLPGQTAGLLGGRYDRFQVSGNPNLPEFQVSALKLPANRQSADLKSREHLLQELDTLPLLGEASKMRALQQRTLDLVSSDAIRRSFEISAEN